MLESNYYLKTVIETMQDGLMVVDPGGIIVSVNRTMEELTGYSRAELIGNHCSILECDTCFRYRAADQAIHCELLSLGKLHRRKCVLKKKNGLPVYVLKNAAVLNDRDGQLIGGVETLTDLSDVVARDRVIQDLQREMSIEEGFHGILGKSSRMLRLYDLIESAAQSEAPVVIMGESGTGKELAAKAIHELGPRSGGPSISVNCAALNDSLLESELFGHVKGAFTGADRQRAGRFEAGNGGDIFLDEIGDLPLGTQVKLLRVLQEKVVERVGENKPIPVDVRIISATNKDLKSMMAEGLFREDLYYRIGVIPIHLPPLRERREDIPLLVDAFIKRIAIRSGRNISGISQQALKIMMDYPWPGNVRELINVVEYAFVLCRRGLLQVEHLPADLVAGDACGPVRNGAKNNNKNEKEKIIAALAKANGQKTEAARLLGVSRVTLWKKIKKYQLEGTD